MKIKICNSRTQVDWLEGELVKLTGYVAGNWVEILSESKDDEWCRLADLHDFIYDEKLKNRRYLFTNGVCPIPVVLSGYTYTSQGGQVYYSAGMTIDGQRMNLLPTNQLIRITKREEPV
jgi:hypothetical protein